MIFETALALTGRTPQDGEELITLLPYWLNVLIGEALVYENSIRKKANRQPLEKTPIVTADNLETELDLADDICKICLPYGVAALIWQEDENDYRALSERAKFINALNEADKPEVSSIKNVYG